MAQWNWSVPRNWRRDYVVPVNRQGPEILYWNRNHGSRFLCGRLSGVAALQPPGLGSSKRLSVHSSIILVFIDKQQAKTSPGVFAAACWKVGVSVPALSASFLPPLRAVQIFCFQKCFQSRKNNRNSDLPHVRKCSFDNFEPWQFQLTSWFVFKLPVNKATFCWTSFRRKWLGDFSMPTALILLPVLRLHFRDLLNLTHSSSRTCR